MADPWDVVRQRQASRAASALGLSDSSFTPDNELDRKLQEIINSDLPFEQKLEATRIATEGADGGEGLLEKALNTLNKPASAASAIIGKGVQGASNAFWGRKPGDPGYYEDTGVDAMIEHVQKNKGFADIINQNEQLSSLPEPHKIALGFAADVGADPTSYIMPASAVERLGGKGLARVALEGGEHGLAQKLMNEGFAALSKVERANLEEIARGAGKLKEGESLAGGAYARLPFQEKLGLSPDGVKLWGGGGSQSARLAAVGERTLKGARNLPVVDSIARSLGGNEGKQALQEIIRTGTPDEAAQAFHTLDAISQGRVAEATTRVALDREASSLKNYLDGMGIDDESALRILEGADPATELPHLDPTTAADVGDNLRTMDNAVRDLTNANAGSEVYSFRADHAPWRPTAEFRELMGSEVAPGQGPMGGFGQSGAERQAKLVAGGEFLGEDLLPMNEDQLARLRSSADDMEREAYSLRTNDPERAAALTEEADRLRKLQVHPEGLSPRAQAEAIAKEQLGDNYVKMGSTKYRDVLDTQIEIASRRAGKVRIENELKARGVATDAYRAYEVPSPAANKFAKMTSDLADYRLDAKIRKATLDQTRLEAKDAARRAAQADWAVADATKAAREARIKAFADGRVKGAEALDELGELKIQQADALDEAGKALERRAAGIDVDAAEKEFAQRAEEYGRTVDIEADRLKKLTAERDKLYDQMSKDMKKATAGPSRKYKAATKRVGEINDEIARLRVSTNVDQAAEMVDTVKGALKQDYARQEELIAQMRSADGPMTKEFSALQDEAAALQKHIDRGEKMLTKLERQQKVTSELFDAVSADARAELGKAKATADELAPLTPEQQMDRFEQVQSLVDQADARIASQADTLDEAVRAQKANADELASVKAEFAREHRNLTDAARAKLDEQIGLRQEAEGLFTQAADMRREALAPWTQTQRVVFEAETRQQLARAAVADLEAQAKAAQASWLRSERRVLTVEDAIAKFDEPFTVTKFESLMKDGMSRLSKTTLAPEDITKILHEMSQFTSKADMGGIMKAFDYVTKVFKTYALMTPGFHFRNFFGGMFNNALHGVSMESYHAFLASDRAYMKALRNGASVEEALAAVPKAHRETFAQMVDMLDLFGNTSEISQFADAARVTKLRDAAKGTQTLTNNAASRLSRRAGDRVERALRGSLAFHDIQQGLGREAALDNVFKYHFDYEDLSHFEQGARKVIPFYTWTRKNLPLMLESMLRKPRAFTRYLQAKHNIEAQSEPEAIVPSWYKNTLTIHLGNGQYLFPELPFKDVNKLTSPREVAGMVNPVIKTPIEMLTGTQLYNGQEFRPGFQEVPDSYNAMGIGTALETMGLAKKNKDGVLEAEPAHLYAIEQFMPAFGRAKRLIPGDDKRGQERLTTTYLSFLFGVGARTNTSVDKENELWARGRALDALSTNYESLGYDTYRRGEIDMRSRASKAADDPTAGLSQVELRALAEGRKR